MRSPATKRTQTLSRVSKSVEITKNLSNAQAEAEDEKLIINLFKRKLSTDKEKALETAPFQEPGQLNPH